MSIKDYNGIFLGILVALYLLLCQGCMKLAIQDKRLAEYITDFSQHYNVDDRDVSVTFISDFSKIIGTTENTIGLCREGIFSTPNVNILDSYYFATTSISRKALVFHELGHCVMQWQHDNTLDSEGCAVTYMNAYLPSDYCLQKIFTANGISY